MHRVKKLSTPLLFLALASAHLGCHVHRIPFRHSLKQKHGLNDKQLAKLQFYLSHDIVLRRSATEKAVLLAGRLQLQREEHVTEIIIRRGTAGVLVQQTKGRLGLSFAENTVLEFERRSQPLSTDPGRTHAQIQGPFATAPSQTAHDVAAQQTGSWMKTGQRYFLRTDNKRVRFAGETWTVHGDSLRAHLLIDTEDRFERTVNRQKLSGLRID